MSVYAQHMFIQVGVYSMNILLPQLSKDFELKTDYKRELFEKIFSGYLSIFQEGRIQGNLNIYKGKKWHSFHCVSSKQDILTLVGEK